MKIGGIDVKSPHEEITILRRGEVDIPIIATAVTDWDTFEKLCPEPQAPGKLIKNVWTPDPTDPGYRTIRSVYESNRLAYLIIKSLEPSNIEWLTVNIDDPSTWSGYLKDFADSNISGVEVSRIITCVMQANSLDEGKLEEARKVFLRGRTQTQNTSSGLQTEPVTMPSTESANVSV